MFNVEMDFNCISMYYFGIYWKCYLNENVHSLGSFSSFFSVGFKNIFRTQDRCTDRGPSCAVSRAIDGTKTVNSLNYAWN